MNLQNKIYMSVKERLIKFIKFLNLSQRKFEQSVGLSNGYINNITKSIGADKMQMILCKFPELNSTWLLTGEGEMLKPPKNEYSQIPRQEMMDIWAEEFDKYLMKMYKEGDVFPVAVVNKMMAEKEAKIEELQKRIWELENKLADK